MQPSAHATTTAHTPTTSESSSKTPSRKPSATPENLNWADSQMMQSFSFRSDSTTDQLTLVAQKLTRLSLGIPMKRHFDDEATNSNIPHKKLK